MARGDIRDGRSTSRPPHPVGSTPSGFDQTPSLAVADRELLTSTLRSLIQAIADRGAATARRALATCPATIATKGLCLQLSRRTPTFLLLAVPKKKPATVDFRHSLRDALVEADPDCFKQSNEE
jgi:hypothetical protein